MEALLTILVLVLLSAVSGWLKKRTETEEPETRPLPPRRSDRSPPSPHPSAPDGSTTERRPSTRSWEEELRRLLEGEPPPPPPPPRAPAPHPARPGPPPPIIAIPRSAPPPLVMQSPVPLHPVEVSPLELVDLRGTSTARQQTQRLKERAAVELKRAEALVARNLAQTRVTHADGMTAEITAARNWIGSPEAARKAVIASVILGPPVGL